MDYQNYSNNPFFFLYINNFGEKGEKINGKTIKC